MLGINIQDNISFLIYHKCKFIKLEKSITLNQNFNNLDLLEDELHKIRKKYFKKYKFNKVLAVSSANKWIYKKNDIEKMLYRSGFKIVLIFNPIDLLYLTVQQYNYAKRYTITFSSGKHIQRIVYGDNQKDKSSINDNYYYDSLKGILTYNAQELINDKFILLKNAILKEDNKYGITHYTESDYSNNIIKSDDNSKTKRNIVVRRGFLQLIIIIENNVKGSTAELISKNLDIIFKMISKKFKKINIKIISLGKTAQKLQINETPFCKNYFLLQQSLSLLPVHYIAEFDDLETLLNSIDSKFEKDNMDIEIFKRILVLTDRIKFESNFEVNYKLPKTSILNKYIEEESSDNLVLKKYIDNSDDFILKEIEKLCRK